MKIKSAVFERSAPDLAACPRWNMPEVAFIGRSNVGKSSLINLLTERGDLAKTSSTPGKTQLINFFRLNGSWCLVDLPGYGYAKVTLDQRADFNEAVANYLEKRDNLAGVFVLIDSRLEPQRLDLQFIQWLESVSLPFALVFTKADKQSASRTQDNVNTFLKSLAEWRTEMPPVFISSVKTKSGRSEILGHVEKLLAKGAVREAGKPTASGDVI